MKSITEILARSRDHITLACIYGVRNSAARRVLVALKAVQRAELRLQISRTLSHQWEQTYNEPLRIYIPFSIIILIIIVYLLFGATW